MNRRIIDLQTEPLAGPTLPAPNVQRSITRRAQKILSLSTSHASPLDFELLKAKTSPIPSYEHPDGYGNVIPVMAFRPSGSTGPWEVEGDLLADMVASGLSAAFVMLYRAAAANDVDFVRFDADADDVDEFIQVVWDEIMPAVRTLAVPPNLGVVPSTSSNEDEIARTWIAAYRCSCDHRWQDMQRNQGRWQQNCNSCGLPVIPYHVRAMRQVEGFRNRETLQRALAEGMAWMPQYQCPSCEAAWFSFDTGSGTRRRCPNGCEADGGFVSPYVDHRIEAVLDSITPAPPVPGPEDVPDDLPSIDDMAIEVINLDGSENALRNMRQHGEGYVHGYVLYWRCATCSHEWYEASTTTDDVNACDRCNDGVNVYRPFYAIPLVITIEDLLRNVEAEQRTYLEGLPIDLPQFADLPRFTDPTQSDDEEEDDDRTRIYEYSCDDCGMSQVNANEEDGVTVTCDCGRAIHASRSLSHEASQAIAGEGDYSIASLYVHRYECWDCGVVETAVKDTADQHHECSNCSGDCFISIDLRDDPHVEPSLEVRTEHAIELRGGVEVAQMLFRSVRPDSEPLGYYNYYHCDHCAHEWDDRWTHDDAEQQCPQCLIMSNENNANEEFAPFVSHPITSTWDAVLAQLEPDERATAEAWVAQIHSVARGRSVSRRELVVAYYMARNLAEVPDQHTIRSLQRLESYNRDGVLIELARLVSYDSVSVERDYAISNIDAMLRNLNEVRRAIVNGTYVEG